MLDEHHLRPDYRDFHYPYWAALHSRSAPASSRNWSRCRIESRCLLIPHYDDKYWTIFQDFISAFVPNLLLRQIGRVADQRATCRLSRAVCTNSSTLNQLFWSFWGSGKTVYLIIANNPLIKVYLFAHFIFFGIYYYILKIVNRTTQMSLLKLRIFITISSSCTMWIITLLLTQIELFVKPKEVFEIMEIK